MTTIPGPINRPEGVGFDSFADLTDLPVLAVGPAGVTFDGDLDDATATQVLDWLRSRDDTQMAQRLALCEAIDGGATNLAQMIGCYLLERPVPAPAYPPVAAPPAPVEPGTDPIEPEAS